MKCAARTATIAWLIAAVYYIYQCSSVDEPVCLAFRPSQIGKEGVNAA
jgi:hypothetical protein